MKLLNSWPSCAVFLVNKVRVHVSTVVAHTTAAVTTKQNESALKQDINRCASISIVRIHADGSRASMRGVSLLSSHAPCCVKPPVQSALPDLFCVANGQITCPSCVCVCGSPRDILITNSIAFCEVVIFVRCGSDAVTIMVETWVLCTIMSVLLLAAH